jgi:hypothetical protein
MNEIPRAQPKQGLRRLDGVDLVALAIAGLIFPYTG